MKTCSETFQFEKDLKWENPAPGVNRQIMAYDGQLMMVKVKFDQGAIGSMHEHYHSQATYVVSGKLAPDELHGCVCLEAGILIDTFSPVRADFLNL